eukprot:6209158-Pleurochrysis_carterae.AAC.1
MVSECPGTNRFYFWDVSDELDESAIRAQKHMAKYIKASNVHKLPSRASEFCVQECPLHTSLLCLQYYGCANPKTI